LSSDSRSSANIVDHASPTESNANYYVTSKNLNANRQQLTRYNQSNKLKQYIADVNKINLRKSEILAKQQSRKETRNIFAEAKTQQAKKQIGQAALGVRAESAISDPGNAIQTGLQKSGFKIQMPKESSDCVSKTNSKVNFKIEP